MNVDLTRLDERKAILDEIKSDDNYNRKREHQKRFDVMMQRQDRYILERLRLEFDNQTVNQMRKILSINLVPEIIRQMSSVYKKAPHRSFASRSGRVLPEREQMQIDNLYYYSKADQNLLKTNQFLNLHDQIFLMCLPDKKGIIKAKPVSPMHLDVVPDEDDVETAHAYILNVWDKDLYKNSATKADDSTMVGYRQIDQINQKIADNDDRQKVLERFVVWTKEFHFTMNGKGEITKDILPNPIEKLPFIDIAKSKDFQFFVRTGTSLVDFALDMGLLLSDTANTIRLQSYAQAVMTSEKPPTNLVVGPNNVLWLPLDPNNPGAKPSFEYASPSPDINGSLEFMEMCLNMFLSSRGLDTSTISGKAEGKTFSSGVERLLAMIDRFEATRDDFDLFKNVEYQLFDLMRDWSNVMWQVNDEEALVDDLRLSSIGEDVELQCKFHEPQMVQTESEKEDSALKMLEAGLMSRVEALMKLRGVDRAAAEQIVAEIDQEVIVAEA